MMNFGEIKDRIAIHDKLEKKIRKLYDQQFAAMDPILENVEGLSDDEIIQLIDILPTGIYRSELRVYAKTERNIDYKASGRLAETLSQKE